MVPTLFVVADQSEAHLYKVGGTPVHPTLEAIDALEHPEARAHLDPSESSSAHLHVDTSRADAEEERRFVRELVERLRKGQSEGEFRKLYIAAPANFVGRLRKHYGSLSRCVEREIIGDYTRQDARTLTKRFAKWSAD